MERLLAGEVRAEGRTLSGIVMPYGVRASDRPERFEPGSLIRDENTWLDLDHDPSRVLAWEGANLTFTDATDALRMRAELPAIPLADLALASVRDGTRRGLSVEFRSIEERQDAGERVISRALLEGIGIVRAGAYRGAQITEVRARNPSRTRISGKTNLGKELACRCRKGCNRIQIEPDAFDVALKEAEDGKRDVTAFFSGSFDKPIASVSKDTLNLERVGDVLRFAIDGLPDSGPVRDFLASLTSGRFVMRPYFPDDQSKFSVSGDAPNGLATFTDADLRAIEIAALTGPMEGLEEVVVDVKPERRNLIWL